jgi:hypothetical protein
MASLILLFFLHMHLWIAFSNRRHRKYIANAYPCQSRTGYTFYGVYKWLWLAQEDPT